MRKQHTQKTNNFIEKDVKKEKKRKLNTKLRNNSGKIQLYNGNIIT